MECKRDREYKVSVVLPSCDSSLMLLYRHIITPTLGLSQFRYRAIKYGLTPRLMKRFSEDSEHELEVQFDTFIKDCYLELFTEPKKDMYRFATDISLYLMQVDPFVFEDGTVSRKLSMQRFVSTHVVERIMKVRKRELADEARKVVRSFSPRSALRSAEGELFKMIGHSTLFRIRASLHLRPLQPSQPGFGIQPC